MFLECGLCKKSSISITAPAHCLCLLLEAEVRFLARSVRDKLIKLYHHERSLMASLCFCVKTGTI